jgi:presenilin-like A22 family membrane protease
MKHTLKVTFVMIALFLIAQLVGLVTISNYLQVNENADTGEVTISYPDTILGPPAQVENKSTSFLFIGAFILIGTGLFLLIVKYKVYKVWKLWFFLAVWATVSVALGVYINWIYAAAIAFGLGLWKIFKPNVYIYNLTEIFIYTGIAILMLSVLDIFAAFGLLVIISLYDMYAVWKSKHMITMAKFQTDAKMFAGLVIPYTVKDAKETAVKTAMKKNMKGLSKSAAPSKGNARQAILGGGDIAFPLIFSGTAMQYLINMQHISKPNALAFSGIISFFAAAALFWLLAKAEHEKFYPAMPFISIGCFVGFLVIMLII